MSEVAVTVENTCAGVMYLVRDRVLLILRSTGCADYPRVWGFPFGAAEPTDATPEQTAIRECIEEVSHTPVNLGLIEWSDGASTFLCELNEEFVPVLNSESDGYMWCPVYSPPVPMHPGAEKILGKYSELIRMGVALDAREYDGNGWYTVKANPISKAGVFPYLGKQLGLTGPDAERMINVFRPPEELADPACIESFKLLPWVDNHVMLGPTAQEDSPGAVAAEQKGVQGVIGEEVFFKDNTLFANLKVFSDTLAALIEAGKRELSAGYRCLYEFISGTWEGQPYEAVQRKIRGNHLALVAEGRMGPDVAVKDSFTFDSRGIEMADPKDKAKGADEEVAGIDVDKLTLGEISALYPKLMERIGALTKASVPPCDPNEPTDLPLDNKDTVPPVKDANPAATPTVPAIAAPVKDADPAATPAAMDANAIARKVLASLGQRDSLAKQISAHIGTFDHSAMTLDDVVTYGCDKLGVKADGPQSVKMAVLGGFLQAKGSVVPSPTVTTAADTKTPAFMENYLKAEA